MPHGTQLSGWCQSRECCGLTIPKQFYCKRRQNMQLCFFITGNLGKNDCRSFSPKFRYIPNHKTSAQPYHAKLLPFHHEEVPGTLGAFIKPHDAVHQPHRGRMLFSRVTSTRSPVKPRDMAEGKEANVSGMYTITSSTFQIKQNFPAPCCSTFM